MHLVMVKKYVFFLSIISLNIFSSDSERGTPEAQCVTPDTQIGSSFKFDPNFEEKILNTAAKHTACKQRASKKVHGCDPLEQFDSVTAVGEAVTCCSVSPGLEEQGTKGSSWFDDMRVLNELKLSSHGHKNYQIPRTLAQQQAAQRAQQFSCFEPQPMCHPHPICCVVRFPNKAVRPPSPIGEEVLVSEIKPKKVTFLLSPEDQLRFEMQKSFAEYTKEWELGLAEREKMWNTLMYMRSAAVQMAYMVGQTSTIPSSRQSRSSTPPLSEGTLACV
jgi:hypothetical protein